MGTWGQFVKVIFLFLSGKQAHHSTIHVVSKKYAQKVRKREDPGV
jgi:hypothetical protein